MSTETELLCKTCGERRGLPWDRSFDRTRGIVALAPMLAALSRRCDAIDAALAQEGGYGNAFNGPSFSPDGSSEMALSWFVKHDGHEIVAITEYGEELEPVRFPPASP